MRGPRLLPRRNPEIIIERPGPVKTAIPESIMPTGRSRGMSRRSWFVVALSLLAALQAAPPVWAWGRLGHRLTARIAERNLNPKARAAVKALLEEGESLADASTWADEHRRDLNAYRRERRLLLCTLRLGRQECSKRAWPRPKTTA